MWMKDHQVATFRGLMKYSFPSLYIYPEVQFSRNLILHTGRCICYTLVNIYGENKDKMYCLEVNTSISHTNLSLCFGTNLIKTQLIRNELIGSLTPKLILILMIYVSNWYIKSMDHLCCWLGVIISRSKGFVSRENPEMEDTVSLKWCNKNYFLN
jgi:hypothetical protein